MTQHIHILGICGTFMGGLALIARELGYQVSGSDRNVYPPMSTQLREAGIELHEGYDDDPWDTPPDLVIVGNALSRGMPVIERLLNGTIPYISGPQWLGENLLRDRWVLAISGTHGKTTTSSLLAWMLDQAGLEPGFLIGGVTANFGVSARVGGDTFFVIEADEYDTAFFDKRSKFLHYHPRTLIINNLEFDHADIFASLYEIQTQFHHLLRVLPNHGLLIHPDQDSALDAVIERGLWSDSVTLGSDGGGDWSCQWQTPETGSFQVTHQQQSWLGQTGLRGDYNLRNILAATAAAHHVGVSPQQALSALSSFQNTKRRQEIIAQIGDILVIDDFAHHPTAIRATLEGLRSQYPQRRLLAVIEPRSNTMRMGVHTHQLAQAIEVADRALWLDSPELQWDLTTIVPADSVASSVDLLLAKLLGQLGPTDIIVCMSNGAFQGFREHLVSTLRKQYESIDEHND